MKQYQKVKQNHNSKKEKKKKGGKGLGCGGRSLSRSGVWAVGNREQKGTEGAQARLWSQRAGDPTWEPSRFPGLEWVGQMTSAPLLLLRSRRAPPTCLSCSAPAFLLRPQDQRGPEGASEGVGPSRRAGQTSPSD